MNRANEIEFEQVPVGERSALLNNLLYKHFNADKIATTELLAAVPRPRLGHQGIGTDEHSSTASRIVEPTVEPLDG